MLLLSLSEENQLEKIVYPLHEEHGISYLALKMGLQQPKILYELNNINDIKMKLVEQLQKMFAQQVFRVNTLFCAETFANGGIEFLRNTLVEGYEVLNEHCFNDSNCGITCFF